MESACKVASILKKNLQEPQGNYDCQEDHGGQHQDNEAPKRLLQNNGPTQHGHHYTKMPPFGDFILEENLDGGWRKDVRNKRFVVTGSLIFSSLVGLLIPVFAGSVVHCAKVNAESTMNQLRKGY